jgi:hypothetical protein
MVTLFPPKTRKSFYDYFMTKFVTVLKCLN